MTPHSLGRTALFCKNQVHKAEITRSTLEIHLKMPDRKKVNSDDK